VKGRFYGLICLALLAARAAAGCDLCGVYMATAAKESRAGFFVGAYEQYESYSTLQFDSKSVDNVAAQSFERSLTQLVGGYRFNDRFSLQVDVPLIDEWYRRILGTSIQTGTTSGLGDLALLGDFLVWQRGTMDNDITVHLLGGLKFPTGSTSWLAEGSAGTSTNGSGGHIHALPRPADPNSAVHGHELTLGSGSYDGIVGGSVNGRWNRVFAAARAQYAIRTIGDYYYQFANDLTWSGGPGYYFWLGRNGTFSAQVNLSGENKPEDTFRIYKVVNTGFTTVFVGPEFWFTWKENFSAAVGVDVPVIEDNTALQLVPDYRLRFAASWRF